MKYTRVCLHFPTFSFFLSLHHQDNILFSEFFFAGVSSLSVGWMQYLLVQHCMLCPLHKKFLC
jgi:hypothetical protein